MLPMQVVDQVCSYALTMEQKGMHSLHLFYATLNPKGE